MTATLIKRALVLAALILAVASFAGMGPSLLAIAIIALCLAVLL